MFSDLEIYIFQVAFSFQYILDFSGLPVLGAYLLWLELV
jgi:hypothetical protein